MIMNDKELSIFIIKQRIEKIELEKKLKRAHKDELDSNLARMNKTEITEAIASLPPSIRDYVTVSFCSTNAATGVDSALSISPNNGKLKVTNQEPSEGYETETHDSDEESIISVSSAKKLKISQERVEEASNNENSKNNNTTSTKSRNSSSPVDKYLDKRSRNNLAAKKSRESKRKYQELRQQRNKILSDQNSQLQKELKQLENEYKNIMKMIEEKNKKSDDRETKVKVDNVEDVDDVEKNVL